MFIEQRTYILHTGVKLADFLDAYENIGLPVQRRIQRGFLGYFVSEIGTLNQVMHLWAYDSLDDRDRRRAEVAAEPEWQRCLEIIRPMIKSMENTIYKPTSFSPIRSLPVECDDFGTAFTWQR
ncbi:NIPSNAP family protein [Paramicrobacterium chengjingii]|uniref:NIPSNAP family protein n=1 Tax=Paramicrobacterium chengjingii TaxID=2769067 RepID=A0ABX6YHL8_9MICO|nr:NIPSNAP family protein [Microbacterium chengjingii]QPZ38268.1 NIPSNAP family protein [Microbacterium chengjingii]